MKWKVKTICGYAGGNSQDAMLNCEIETKSDTVDEIRQKVEAAPDLLEACQYALKNLNPKGGIKKDFSGHNAMATLSRAIYKATGKTK